MKLSIVRALSLAAPLATLVGCAASTAPTDTESTDSSSSAMASAIQINPGPIFTLDPVALCSGITADQSHPYSSAFGYEVFGGTSNASRSCDYSVFEVTGTMSQYLRLSLTDLAPKGDGSSYPLQYPYTQVTQATCAASYIDYEAFGWVPPKWVLNGQQVVMIPGKWEAIGTEQIAGGTWAWGPGEAGQHCTFGTIESAGAPASRWLVEGVQTHSIVRVAVKAVVSTPSGTVRAPLYVFQEPG